MGVGSCDISVFGVKTSGLSLLNDRRRVREIWRSVKRRGCRVLEFVHGLNLRRGGLR